MTVQELLRRLPELSQADLEKVRHRVQLLAGSTKTQGPKSSTDDWLLGGFERELKRRGLIADKVWKGALPSNWAEKSEPVQTYLLKGSTKKLATAERISLGQMAAASLFDYFERYFIHVSPTPRLLFHNVEKVPAALEASFPGYWAARTLDFCLKGSTTSWSPKS